MNSHSQILDQNSVHHLLREIMDYPNKAVKNKQTKFGPKPLHELEEYEQARIFQINSVNDLNPDAARIMQKDINDLYEILMAIKDEKNTLPITNQNIISILDRVKQPLENALQKIITALTDTNNKEWNDIKSKFNEDELKIFNHNLFKSYIYCVAKLAREGKGFGVDKSGSKLDVNANDLAILVCLVANNTVDLLSKKSDASEILKRLEQIVNKKQDDEDYTYQLVVLFEQINKNSQAKEKSKSKEAVFFKRKSSPSLFGSSEIVSRSDSDSSNANKSSKTITKRTSTSKINFIRTNKSTHSEVQMSSSPTNTSLSNSSKKEEYSSSETSIKFDESSFVGRSGSIGDAQRPKLSRSTSSSINDNQIFLNRSNSNSANESSKSLNRVNSSGSDSSPKSRLNSIEGEKIKKNTITLKTTEKTNNTSGLFNNTIKIDSEDKVSKSGKEKKEKKEKTKIFSKK